MTASTLTRRCVLAGAAMSVALAQAPAFGREADGGRPAIATVGNSAIFHWRQAARLVPTAEMLAVPSWSALEDRLESGDPAIGGAIVPWTWFRRLEARLAARAHVVPLRDVGHAPTLLLRPGFASRPGLVLAHALASIDDDAALHALVPGGARDPARLASLPGAALVPNCAAGLIDAALVHLPASEIAALAAATRVRVVPVSPRPELAALPQPTLVLFRSGTARASANPGRALASRLPDLLSARGGAS